MWHEARRSERKVHDLMDAARKRAQRRAVYLAKRRGDPQQSLQVAGTRCRVHRDDGLYQAAQDQQGLIPWNGKQDVLIDRFDGRALLDFIRDSSTRAHRVQEKTEEEEEVEELVNFERYRDLIKLRRRGFTDEEGLQHVRQELEAKNSIPFAFERPQAPQPSASKGSYSQVGFSYKGDGHEDSNHLDSENEDEDDEEDDDDEKDFSSDDSNDEKMEIIAKEFGIKRYNWLVYMDKKAKEEEKRQKEIIRGDPAIRKLSRKERRKASQMEREREREAARLTGRAPHHDPYRESRRSPTYDAYPRSRRSRSRSRSHSPSHSRRHERSSHGDNGHRNKSKPPKIEYITEFGGSNDLDDQKFEAVSPPSSPVQAELSNRPSGGRILEALHVDPASALSLEQEKNAKIARPSISSSSSAIAKLSKTPVGGASKTQQGEKKETPQERLKRIMSKQLNKQIRKDTAAEIAKKREQERQRQERLAEASRISRYSRRSRSRSYSPSPPRRRHHSRSRSRSRSPRKHYSHSRSHSRSHSPRSRSRTRY
ncbi:CLK4-associating serine/arginine rich protein [Canna indica]|uniref:CLK4-associating serine/arginine rich protein n=1 Tax=Canna indica TaxID=4628 RepID=A0AAQ3Q892_9LILI|nr:CLK4-associating serine/arginine rich protein [Canna indica]